MEAGRRRLPSLALKGSPQSYRSAPETSRYRPRRALRGWGSSPEEAGDSGKASREPHPRTARRFAPPPGELAQIETPSRAGARFGEFRFVVFFVKGGNPRGNPLSRFPPKTRAANRRFAAILFFARLNGLSRWNTSAHPHSRSGLERRLEPAPAAELRHAIQPHHGNGVEPLPGEPGRPGGRRSLRLSPTPTAGSTPPATAGRRGCGRAASG